MESYPRRGPRGGKYVFTSTGEKVYIDPRTGFMPYVERTKEGGVFIGPQVFTGPRGGRYILDKNGNKIYLARENE